jgi:hypothetical protein
MAYVITLEGIIPLPRYDDLPWTQATLEEAADSVGPWIIIDAFVLDPLDDDPSNPAPRNFTTENATLEVGWYRVIFTDQNGDQQLPTEAQQNTPPQPNAGFLPSVSDVADLLRARTKDNLGNEIGTFTEDTRPTSMDVLHMIEKASNGVTSWLDYDIPEEMYEQTRVLVTVGAAMLVELSYFPEQVGTDRTAYDELKALYDQGLEALKAALAREQAEEMEGTEFTSGNVRFGFPYAEPIWSKKF